MQNSNSSHPNINHAGFSAFNFSDNASSTNTPPFSNGTRDGHPTSFASSTLPRPSSCRSRPRLVKVRKQFGFQQARSRMTSIEVAPGFNPFRVAKDGSDQVTTTCSTSNELSGSSSSVENGGNVYNGFCSSWRCTKLANAGFVFGAKSFDSHSLTDVNTGVKGETKRRGKADFAVDTGKVMNDNSRISANNENLGYVFCAKQVEFDSRLCHGRRGSCECRKSKSASKDNSCSVSGANYNNIGAALDRDIKDTGYNNVGIKETVIADKRGTDSDASGSISNSEEKVPRANTTNSSFIPNLNFGVQEEAVASNCKNFDFVFGGSFSNTTSCLKPEMRDVSEKLGWVPHDDKAKLEVKKEGVTERTETAHKQSNANESLSGNTGYGNGDFVFKSSNNYKFHDLRGKETNHFDEMLNSDENKTNVHTSKFSFNDGCEYCPGSSMGMPTVRSTIPTFVLPKEMDKLNINDRKSGDGEDVDNCFNINSFVDIKDATVSISCQNACDRIDSNSGANSNGQELCHPAVCDKAGSNAQGASVVHPLVQGKFRNTSTSLSEGSNVSSTDFIPPKWDPSCFRENLFPGVNKKLDFSMKSNLSKEKGHKKLRKKSKTPVFTKKSLPTDHLPKQSSSFEKLDSPRDNSPMEYSPYQESIAPSNCSANPGNVRPEHFTASRGEEIHSQVCEKCKNLCQTRCQCHGGSSFVHEHHLSGATGFGSSTVTPSSNYANGLADSHVDIPFGSFSFSGISVQASLPNVRHKYKKTSRRKAAVTASTSNEKLEFRSTQCPDLVKNSSGFNMTDCSEMYDPSKQAATLETCDKWRIRGNQAYKTGDLSKAENLYTQGINAVPSCERSGFWLKPLLLCYSNRAAARMALGRVREALEDCVMASALDPSFLKVHIRAAKCHLLLGELEDAQKYFSTYYESSNGVCLDRRVTVEAAEGIQNAQKVSEYFIRSAKLLEQKTPDAVWSALELITEALTVSLYSEKLLQLKAEALCLLQKYEEAIQLCEQSQSFAEKNFASASNAVKANVSGRGSLSCIKLWRWSLISRCYFHLGKLEASLDTLEKLGQDEHLKDMCGIVNPEMSLSLASSVRELLSRKRAGNEAFKSGNYKEAVEHYTTALSSSPQSRPFAAVCFCNRAAAYQALGQITDSISDCSLAVALDGNYAKAISRRATLHEMVRDYEQAASDLRRLVDVLQIQPPEKAMQSGTPGRLNGGFKNAREAHQHLLSVEEQAKKEIPLDLYLILGVKPSDAAADIKKAYHKAALRHHPDKAGLLLARSEVGDEGRLWKEISQEVHKDADRLFKMIGEAYAVLSDPAKRSEYDIEEDMRKAPKTSNRSSSGRTSDVNGYGRTDGYSSPFGRSTSRRQGRGNWKTHGYSYSYW